MERVDAEELRLTMTRDHGGDKPAHHDNTDASCLRNVSPLQRCGREVEFEGYMNANMIFSISDFSALNSFVDLHVVP